MAAVKKVLASLWQPGSADNEKNNNVKASKLDDDDYSNRVEEFRPREYPTLVGTTYLDHAGTTPYAKSAIESWTTELTTNLFGNPHSASAASQLSTRRIDDVRLRVLRFFKADPEQFDVVFVANATAAIKLVAEAFRDHDSGFWYGYHADSHTSVVGCRELAVKGSRCFANDGAVNTWIDDMDSQGSSRCDLGLFAFPGQSNMTGRKLPLEWLQRVRGAASAANKEIYTLLDAASLASTSPLDLSDASNAPDFTALSFYKIFGFPDLGALIVRNDSAKVLMGKKYFAGGTVDAVLSSDSTWHVKKETLHSSLEEGTLPFHNILALDHAMQAHDRLFGSMQNISKHVALLRDQAKQYLTSAHHYNGTPVCEVYEDDMHSIYGPIIAFNISDSIGNVISPTEFEKLCIVKGIQIRTGGLCNPGGIERHLKLTPSQVRMNYSQGHRCGGESTLIEGRPTGVVRISFGAMSTKSDVQSLIRFIDSYFVEHGISEPLTTCPTIRHGGFFVEALSVFPIKSCAAFEIPPEQKWKVTARGLQYDREWCLIHEGTNVALSQKRYPGMALLRPTIDLQTRSMTVSAQVGVSFKSIQLDLEDVVNTAPLHISTCLKSSFSTRSSKVCGDTLSLHVYTDATINDFFSEVLQVPCCLARYPNSGQIRNVAIRRPSPESSPTRTLMKEPAQMKLANESPMLIVCRSSVNELNRQIRNHFTEPGDGIKPREVAASSFRANILIAQYGQDTESPYIEDDWSSISIKPSSMTSESTTSSTSSYTTDDSEVSPTLEAPDTTRHGLTALETTSTRHNSDNSALSKGNVVSLSILGPCQRCQMVSINQATAKSQQEPFSTLARTRRKGDGRVWFGVHAAMGPVKPWEHQDQTEENEMFVRVGDIVEARTD